jgi:hypothetical protein
VSYPTYLPTIGHELAELIDSELYRSLRERPDPNSNVDDLTNAIADLTASIGVDEAAARESCVRIAAAAVRVYKGR